MGKVAQIYTSSSYGHSYCMRGLVSLYKVEQDTLYKGILYRLSAFIGTSTEQVIHSTPT